jgi:hypothetical protein
MVGAKTVVKKKNMLYVCVCTLVLGLGVMGIQASAQTRIALHATQEEVNIWKQRSVSGPYLDDWNRIISRANSFLSNPNAETWVGNQLNQCWNGDAVVKNEQPPNALLGRAKGDKLRDAAFVYLIKGDTKYRDAVRTTLLKQAGVTGTNFANTKRWCTNYESDGFNLSQDFEITNWLRRLVYAYSYIRPTLSAGDQTTLDSWFRNAGNFWANALHNTTKLRFPNRLNDDYSACTNVNVCPGRDKGATHFGAATRYLGFHYAWSNKEATYAAFVAATGVTIDDAALKAAAKRFAKEWLMFAVGADGTVADQHRWVDGTAQTGFLYAGTALGSIITIADHLARAGDLELFNFSTSAGFYGWEGGPKTLLKAMQRYASLAIGERNLGGGGVQAYASTTSTSDSAKRIGPGTAYSQDIVMAPANVFYRDESVKMAYTRTMPARPFSAGYDPWGGDWGTYPGTRFMFAQMEGMVQPYKNTQHENLPVPTNIRIVTK